MKHVEPGTPPRVGVIPAQLQACARRTQVLALILCCRHLEIPFFFFFFFFFFWPLPGTRSSQAREQIRAAVAATADPKPSVPGQEWNPCPCTPKTTQVPLHHSRNFLKFLIILKKGFPVFIMQQSCPWVCVLFFTVVICDFSVPYFPYPARIWVIWS